MRSLREVYTDILEGSVLDRSARRWARAYRHRFGPRPFAVSDATEIPPGEFADLFAAHAGRPCVKWIQYPSVYDRHLSSFRHRGPDRPTRLLEIGVFQGGSLELWREYFGPDAVISGVDVDTNCQTRVDPPNQVHIGSQADTDFLKRVVSEMGGIDVVIDDGSHVASHQRATFGALFPLLNDGGVYMIEDTHTAYWLRYDGGFRRPGTAIQMAKALVDGMHKWYFKFPLSKGASIAQRQVRSVCFYDSIVVIEKQLHDQPSAIEVGATSSQQETRGSETA